MARGQVYVPGWIDLSVHDYIGTADPPASSMAYVLISCLDSSYDVSTIVRDGRSAGLHLLKRYATPLGSAVVTTTRRLYSIDRRHRVLFGFDELWFFDHRPADEKPTQLTLVGPGRIRRRAYEGLAEWMGATSCSLAIGDGEGMNFCARVRGVARSIVELLTPQAEG